MPLDIKKSCYCGQSIPYEQCCQVFHLGTQVPSSPETLMRSRYSAFATANADYIFQTQKEILHENVNKDDFQTELQTQKWIRLEVLQSKDEMVAFRACMLYNDILYTMYEKSSFHKHESRWIYSHALEHKAEEHLMQRNDSCPCGSQKKYKKCCQKA